MKLSKIYSNYSYSPSLDATATTVKFKPIRFNPDFNVIYGKVTKPKESDKDSHNLGKSLLIEIIDFLLLKEIDKTHFFKKHGEVFKGFVFFIEIRLNSGKYVTIKRPVDTNTKISFKSHDIENQNYINLPDDVWDHNSVPIERATDLLNTYLNLNIIAPFDYRKGVTYFLRSQKDYLDVFQISKFSIGKHMDWKPYLAKVLGFNDKLLSDKYDTDEMIESRETYKEEYESTLSTKADEYDKLKGAIEIKRTEVAEATDKINKFNFYERELKINNQLVENVEEEIASLNNELYNISYEIEKIKEALSSKVEFNLIDIKNIFDEVNIHLKDNLVKSYEELVEFNKKITKERNKHLKGRLSSIEKEQSETKEKLMKLNGERTELLSIIRDTDTFDKFRLIQKNLVKQETELVRLETQLESLNKIGAIDKEIRELDAKRDELVREIDDNIKTGTEIYKNIRLSFNKIIHEVLNLPAIISIKLNDEGNLEFKTDIVKDEKNMTATSQSEGTTYKKILCAAFDLSVLICYNKNSFYRFVYHDGILEGLDNRKKNNYLKLVRSCCHDYDIQYILTVIDADLPRDDNDAKILFHENEVIRELTDEGKNGRLFSMNKF